jgi:hypothetical protein
MFYVQDVKYEGELQFSIVYANREFELRVPSGEVHN